MSVLEWCNPYQDKCFPGDGEYINPYGPTERLPPQPFTWPALDLDGYIPPTPPLSELVSPAWRPLDDELDALLPYEPPVAVPALYTTWTPLPAPLDLREASAVSEPYVLVLLLVGLVLAGWRRR